MPNSGKPTDKLKGWNPVEQIAGYAKNVAKELGQTVQSVAKTTGAQIDTRSYPPEKRAEMSAKADAASKAQDKAVKQLAGAILQGRRYDDKTGKRK